MFSLSVTSFSKIPISEILPNCLCFGIAGHYLRTSCNGWAQCDMVITFRLVRFVVCVCVCLGGGGGGGGNLWKLGMYSIIRLWHHAKICDWSPNNDFKTKRRKVVTQGAIFIIWCPDENLLHRFESCLLNVKDRVSLKFSKPYLYKLSGKWSKLSWKITKFQETRTNCVWYGLSLKHSAVGATVLWCASGIISLLFTRVLIHV